MYVNLSECLCVEITSNLYHLRNLTSNRELHIHVFFMKHIQTMKQKEIYASTTVSERKCYSSFSCNYNNNRRKYFSNSKIKYKLLIKDGILWLYLDKKIF